VCSGKHGNNDETEWFKLVHVTNEQKGTGAELTSHPYFFLRFHVDSNLFFNEGLTSLYDF
jgi:hypothetical protein